MNTYKVLSNLKFGGTYYEAGSIFEGNAGGEVDTLVEAGVLALIDGTVAEEVTPEVKEEVVAPENTWGPKPDEVPAETTPEVIPEADVVKTEETTPEAPAPEEVKAPEVVTDAPIVDDSNL